MKTKVILLLFILFILSTTGRLVAGSRQDIRAGHNRQNPQLSGQKEEQKKKKAAGLLQPYQGMWKSVDSLTNLGQPRSALKMVNNIYSRAKEEKNEPQFLKTILYRVRLDADFQEDFLDQAVRDIHAELATYMGPASYVMHSILGEIYWKYYQNNVWQLADRTRVNSNETDSLATWDLNTLAQAAVNEYLLSLNNASITRAIPVETYKAILEITGDTSLRNHVNKTDDFLLHPTLFDFLAWRALDFFTCGQQPKTQTSNLFLVDKTGFFAPSPEFSTFLSGPVVSLVGPSYQYDSISRDYFSFRIYQQLVAFHLPDKNPAALIDIELKRLEFMKNKAVFMNTDSLYRMALENLERNFQKSFYTTLVSYQLANWLNGQGQLYRPLESENHRGEILDAATICENAIKRFPASEGAKKCKSLLRSIHEPFLQITCELAVTAENPFLALLGFKNLKELNFRLIKTEPETYAEKSASMERKDFFRYLAEQPATKTWSINLPEMSDYQQHTTEIRIPEVAPGFYVLMGSTDKTFRDPGCTYAATPFWSTRISYVSKRNEKGNLDYFILDRNTGMPMKNIPVEVWTKIYDYTSRKYIATKLNEYFSDDKGFFSIPAPEQKQRETNLFLKIRDKEDLLITDNFYLYPVQPSPERTYQQTMLYTDRAIYRPGQPVYFKGIILEKTGDRSKIRAGQTTTVSFLDVNGQLIAKTKLISNDFGSFNGSFIAPQGVLNGLMTISNESGSVSVSVEEYKRPTFEVVFHPLEGNYKLGKSLTISGKVSAYAGNAIDGAIVRYRVVRTARFPFYDMGWYRPFPVSPETEITHGFTRTGINGQFTIDFRAIPDFSVEKKSNPVFDFRVYADVTDITGEMQSSVQTVSIGYQSLLIGTNIPELVNLLSDSLFTISTTNLNGAHTPADVNINLKHLHQPDHVFKPRVWARPDLMTIARDDFYNQFPNDIYGEDNNPATWSADPGLFEQVLNTGVDSVLHFTKMSRGFYPTGLQPGIYQLVLSSVDPFGEKISKTIVFTVFDPGSKEIPIQTMNWFVPLKTSGEPGETARFIMGSKEENINLIYEIRRHDSLISREWLLLNNRSLLLEIPIHESDRGNFSVNFFFVKNNRAFQNSQVITVPYANKKLDIVCETFRDKLDPGAKEEWKIRISDQDKKGVLAEFLASMYDASLNVFRTNTWTFDLYEKYYTINPWDVNNAFRIVSGQWFSTIGETASEEFNILSGYRLNWFGLPYFGNDYRMGRYRLGTANTDLMMVNSSAKTMEAPS
ncbi:MAG: MG2 domain-containing protein, partial [Bacteroidales bacterium]|nr:MG2 domain-containing protein [Bacteroidales bacterium]